MQTPVSSVSTFRLSAEQSPAIFSTRLAWLCQPEQIEYTLKLLFCLNFWKRACRIFLYADRQGLGEVQALVLEQAVRIGAVRAVAYLDGTGRFPGELLLESVGENAARGILIYLKNLSDPQIWPPFHPEGDLIYRRYIQPLYERLTGKHFQFVADAVEALDSVSLRAYIEEHLRGLVAQARVRRQPLPLTALASLCISPVDLLHIRDNRIYFLDSYDTWNDLDISDQRKLDPEGYSEVAFAYHSESSEFIFHLPFRWAEMFVPGACLRELQQAPGSSQERGIYQGRVIGDERSQEHRPREILQDLGVDIRRVCPHELQEKEIFLARPSIREILWPTRYFEHEDWSDDPWDCICLPPNLI